MHGCEILFYASLVLLSLMCGATWKKEIEFKWAIIVFVAVSEAFAVCIRNDI